FALELNVRITNASGNVATAIFRLDAGLLFDVEVDSARELTCNSTFFLFNESGTLETFDIYSESVNTTFFNNSDLFPNAYQQEVVVGPNSSVVISMNYNGQILGNAFTSRLGDINCDGLVNLLDVASFVDLVSTGEFQFEADINEDGVVNLLDVAPFVDLLSGG
ncbi:MAG: dockerin type I domain-containing protein, partial [Planctomycetota bacterium]